MLRSHTFGFHVGWTILLLLLSLGGALQTISVLVVIDQ